MLTSLSAIHRAKWTNWATGILLGSLLLGCSSNPKDTPSTQEKAVLRSVNASAGIPVNGSTKNLPQKLETIAILGTNDLHGTLAPRTMKSVETDGSPSMTYEVGGAATLAAYVKILKNEFDDHFIWLDAGDEFQGSVESNFHLGAPMVKFFNQNGLNAAAIGNHEFDFGLEVLKKRMREARYPYLAANITNKLTGTSADFPNTLPHTLIKAGDLKVGVIGLTTVETPTKTRAINVTSLRFEDLQVTTLKEAEALRKMGAHIVLLVTHAGLKCDAGRVAPTRLMRKPTDPQGDCGNQDEVVHLLRTLPAGTIDAVVSGHTHQIVHHWVADVPVIQSGIFGPSINVIYLTYDWNLRQLVTDQTRIEGPIPVCAKVFKNQNDCNGERPAPAQGRGPLIAHKFHGEIVHPDLKTMEMLAPILGTAEIEKSKILGSAVLPIPHFKDRESPMGEIVADAMRVAARADVAIINPGGVRDSLQAGPIRFGDAFRVFPFDNEISVLRVTGQELKTILRVSESGFRGFSSVSGLQLRLIEPNHIAPFDDLNGDGKDSLWKMNRILGIKMKSDSFALDKIYTLAISDFLVTGGDDLSWAISKVPPERIQLSTGILIRDALVQYIQKNSPIHYEKRNLADSTYPRLKFEIPPPEPKGKNSKKSGRSKSGSGHSPHRKSKKGRSKS